MPSLCTLRKKLGPLRPDHFVDIIAVDGDPLRDEGALMRVKFVMKDGLSLGSSDVTLAVT